MRPADRGKSEERDKGKEIKAERTAARLLLCPAVPAMLSAAQKTREPVLLGRRRKA
jgi:hypothetical protein